MASHDLTRLPPHRGRVHSVKVWPEFFQAMWTGAKLFEIRLNDRDYQVGDVVDLHEYDPERKMYLDRQLRRRITYITNFLQKDGYIVMQLAP